MSRTIQGLLPVLHTPFLENDSIDRDSLQREIDYTFEHNVDGVCIAVVSELLRLTGHERLELTKLVAEMTAGRGAVVASVGAESTKQAVIYAEAAADAGCDAIMAIPPVTTDLPETMLWDYFESLANAVDIPLVVQDASSYVGRVIPTSFYLRLLEKFGANKILFKPEASPLGPIISELRDATEGQARIFDGSGGLLLVDNYRRGISGTMPGVDMLDGVIALWRALVAGDEERIYQLYFPICAIAVLQLQAGLDGFLAIEKYIMVKRGLFTTDLRRTPFAWSLDVETKSEIDRLLDQLHKALIAG